MTMQRKAKRTESETAWGDARRRGKILAPMDPCQRYQEERSSLNAEIDRVLAETTERLGGAK